MTDVYIALGSNIDPENNLKAAATMLRQTWPEIQFAGVFRTKPWGREDQADFLNAAGFFTTDATLADVHHRLRDIEASLKKNPPFTFGPRTIDLDLLLYGDAVEPDPDDWRIFADRPLPDDYSIVPHPRMHRRRFVLEPLLELIDTSEKHPVLGQTWMEIWKDLPVEGSERMPITL